MILFSVLLCEWISVKYVLPELFYNMNCFIKDKKNMSIIVLVVLFYNSCVHVSYSNKDAEDMWFSLKVRPA